MRFKPESRLFKKNQLTSFTILFIALFYFGTDLVQHNHTRTNPENRGVIHWDIISYYAYLPATFIYGDVTLDFLNHPPEGFVNDNKFWPSRLENGKFLTITSMGLSVLYAPFFFMAHALAPLFGEARDGYGSIYQFFLVMSSLFYVILGFILLRNLLSRYFSSRITALTLLAIALGTNLYHFSTTEAPMPHAYNFFLIVLFLRMVIWWYERSSIFRTILIGALYGFITLVRPTNILVLFLLLLWDVKSWRELGDRIIFFIRKFHLVLIMLAAFIVVWTPQFLYWKEITGHFLFFSYSAEDGAFYWQYPHIFESLFSYKKGWFVYVPIMFFAVLGIALLKKRYAAFFWPTLILLVTMIYVQSSWWSWWYGGCFGLRTYIDIFGVLAIPLAATLQFAEENRKKLIRIGYPLLIVGLILFHQLNNFQYRKNIIHHVGMNKYVYWKSFLKVNRPADYWQTLTMPDYQLARKAIYVYYLTGADNTALSEMDRDEALKQVTNSIIEDKKLHKEVRNYAKRTGISYDEAMSEVAERIYNSKTNQ